MCNRSIFKIFNEVKDFESFTNTGNSINKFKYELVSNDVFA